MSLIKQKVSKVNLSFLNKKERGFVILFAVTLSAILLSISLGVANIAQKEIKFGTSASETNKALGAADTGAECALYYDKSGDALNAFTGSATLSCAGTQPALTTSGSPTNFWSFVIPPMVSLGGCAKVEVDKTTPPLTIITSRGYNTGDGSCESTNPNRVERLLQVRYSSVSTDPLPLGWWTFNDGSGSSTAVDIGSGRNNGSLVGPPTWVAGKIGQALNFSGSGQYVNMGTNSVLNITGPITLAAWVNPDALVRRAVIAKDAVSDRGYLFGVEGTGAVYMERNGGVLLNTGPTMSVGTWNHIAVTFNGTTWRTYLNGVQAATTTAAGIPSTATSLTVGRRNYAGFESYFDGKIDDVRIYDYALSGPAITDLYESVPASAIQDVTWTGAVGVAVSGNSLTKNIATGWGNAGAYSTQTIASGDGYVEFTVGEITNIRMAGLSNGSTGSGYAEIDFAMVPNYVSGQGRFFVYENGVEKTADMCCYAAGDVFRVAVESGVVKYYLNGALRYTSLVAPTYPLLFDTSFYNNGATLNNAKIYDAP